MQCEAPGSGVAQTLLLACYTPLTHAALQTCTLTHFNSRRSSSGESLPSHLGTHSHSPLSPFLSSQASLPPCFPSFSIIALPFSCRVMMVFLVAVIFLPYSPPSKYRWQEVLILVGMCCLVALLSPAIVSLETLLFLCLTCNTTVTIGLYRIHSAHSLTAKWTGMEQSRFKYAPQPSEWQ